MSDVLAERFPWTKLSTRLSVRVTRRAEKHIRRLVLLRVEEEIYILRLAFRQDLAKAPQKIIARWSAPSTELRTELLLAAHAPGGPHKESAG